MECRSPTGSWVEEGLAAVLPAWHRKSVPIGSSFAVSNLATWLPQADAHDPWVLVDKKYRKM
jgi:hypothetical protein